MKAWHITSDTLRDGSPLPPDGVKLVHKGELVMCQSGYHASKRLIDALEYALGHIICRVEVGGEILHDTDKMVCQERTILWRIDGEDVLRRFARLCALDAIDKWDAPDVVVRYLKTGNKDIRDAAWAATRDAWDAAQAAAWDARAAAQDAAWAAARDAWDAARVAARAAWGAARVAAWGAAQLAAWDAAQLATSDAARAAARDAQNKRLTRMVMKARPTR